MHTRLRTPSTEAASKSDCKASRLRSRQVTCSIGSRSLSTRRRATASGAMLMRELCESVRLNASATSLSCSAWASRGARVVPFGGFSSVVTINLPDCKTSANGRVGMYHPSKCDSITFLYWLRYTYIHTLHSYKGTIPLKVQYHGQ